MDGQTLGRKKTARMQEEDGGGRGRARVRAPRWMAQRSRVGARLMARGESSESRAGTGARGERDTDDGGREKLGSPSGEEDGAIEGLDEFWGQEGVYIVDD